jgi:4-alpha-glucanotransferase
MESETMTLGQPGGSLVREALAVLGVRHLLLGIHDAAFPSLPDEDTGRGSPYSAGAAEFLAFVGSLGFTGLQLGPQGATSRGNPSPYDSALFSRNPLSLALGRLRLREQDGLLSDSELAGLVERRRVGTGHARHDRAFLAQRMARRLAWSRFKLRARSGQVSVAAHEGLARFQREHAWWLVRDGLYEALESAHGDRDWRAWPTRDRRIFATSTLGGARARRLLAKHRDAVDEWVFVQYLLHRQHEALRARAAELGLTLFGDLQVGLSRRDVWVLQSLLLADYLMGAPPSRTNPEGQPWNYALMNPRGYVTDETGASRRARPALDLVRARLHKFFNEYDGVRIDHPHGIVCPWVYRGDTADPLAAVRGGTRLFSSPDLADHPLLGRLAIARVDQIDTSQPRHADEWVSNLDDDQVARYSVLLDVVVAEARRRGTGAHAVACEVLSTQPYPLRRAMERHGLGRFRVTQKANVDDPRDGYRGENARPEDWIMLGNHDTPSIWQAARSWCDSGRSRAQAEYLASRLLPPEEEGRAQWIEATAADPGRLAEARCADLFVGPARNVMVFFVDLLGEREQYNRPGTVDPRNWSLRVPVDFRSVYAHRRVQGQALDLPRALARAMRAHGTSFVSLHRQLVHDLEEAAGR